MPCDSIVLNSVLLEAVKDHDLLLKGLQAEFGYVDHNLGAKTQTPWFRFYVDGTQVTLSGGRASAGLDESALQQVVGRVKQAYSREVVASAAKRFGWAIKKGPNANRFSVVKR